VVTVLADAGSSLPFSSASKISRAAEEKRKTLSGEPAETVSPWAD